MATITLRLAAHPWKPDHYVIVDTDGGMDDLRALNLILASSSIRVLAITTSNGVLDAVTCHMKLRSLLADLHHEGIMTGINDDPSVKALNHQPAFELPWGKTNTDGTAGTMTGAADVVNFVLANTTDPVTFICLGSLSTLKLCLDSCSGLRSRLKTALWSSNCLMDENNFNYNLDRDACRSIAGENLNLHLVDGSMTQMLYSAAMAEKIRSLPGDYAAGIGTSLTLSGDPFASRAFDEMSVLYLHFPTLFTSDTTGGMVCHRISALASGSQFQDGYLQVLRGQTSVKRQVLSRFPADTSWYQEDIRPMLRKTLDAYGSEEWNACVLANELHGHLGVYAVIGVKMGIRAREYFGTGIDEMHIVSYAGSVTPFSCLNDGLQVSTGATLGHGLITVSAEPRRDAAAEFTCMGRRIRLELKESHRLQIEKEIGEYSRIYGISSELYWELVRRAAIKYWGGWDRNDIFDLTVY